MTSFRIRPRFRKVVNVPLHVLKDDLIRELAISTKCVVKDTDNHIVVQVPVNERHYWSPQLGLSLEEEDEGTLIRGLYGPTPNVWALFAFGYGALSVLGLFHLIVGFSMWQMGKGTLPLWSLGLEVFLALSLYIAAQMGQKKGAEQLYTLHFLFEEVVHQKLQIE